MTDAEFASAVETYRVRWSDGGWIGRSDPGPRFHDLFIERHPDNEDNFDDDLGDLPRDSLQLLLQFVASIDAMTAAAVDAICSARQSALGWRAGPPLDKWSLIEARLDATGRFWLTAHEYETDEYSAWPVRFDAAGVPDLVLRRPFVAKEVGPRHEATTVWERT